MRNSYRLSRAIYSDNKKAFLNLVKVNPSSKRICSPDIMSILIKSHALKCAKALLEGETGLIVDFNALSRDTGLPPLHELALKNNNVMLDFFLRSGAPADLRCTTDNHYSKMLPINLPLYSIAESCYIKPWTTKQSVFNLIFRLCLRHTKNALRSVKLLASETKGIDDEIYHYFWEGKVIELAALMLADHEKVLSFFQRICYSNPTSGNRTPRQLLTAEIAWLSATEIRLKHSDKYLIHRACEEKLLVRMHTLQLLEICERAGNLLAAYLKFEGGLHSSKEVFVEVAWIFEQAGFTLKHEDLELSPPDKDERWQHIRMNYSRKYAPYFESLESDLSNCITEGILRPLHPKGNKISPERALTNCKAQPYEQWRFASTNHLYGSQSFLVHAFEAFPSSEDISIMCHDSNPMSQLIAAIDKLCNHQYIKEWTCEMSSFKLLYILLVPELTNELVHIREHACDGIDAGKLGLLACYYVKGGKLVELAALFMIAHEKLFARTGSQRTDEIIKIRNCILRKLQIIINVEVRLIRDCLYINSIKDKKVVLSSALLLLEVFERVGHGLEKHLQLHRFDQDACHQVIANEVAFLLEQSGFVLRGEDIFVHHLSCFRAKLQPEVADNLKRFLSAEIGTPISSPPHNYLYLKNIGKARRPQGYPPLFMARRPQGYPPLIIPRNPFMYNTVQPFHTFRIPQDRSNLMLSSTITTRSNGAGMRSHLTQKMSLAKKWGSFVFTIIKGVKQV